MRMFYAVNFADYVKEALHRNLAEIKKHILRGSFTDRNNFHITLVFVGECEPGKTGDLKNVIDNTVKKLKPGQVKSVINGLGTFPRPGDELLWAGVKTEPENILREINKTVVEELSAAGIKLNGEKNKFTPHVTIARKVQFRQISSKDLCQIKFEPIDFTVNSITLMESVQETVTYGERRYTKIIYNPIYEKKF